MASERRQTVKRLTNELGQIICSCGCGRLPGPGRRSWHSKECVDKWMLRNDASTIRRVVYQRDKGVCAGCGINASKTFVAIKKSCWEIFQYGHWALRAKVFSDRNEMDKEVSAYINQLYPGWTLSRSTGYDIDHIIPVVEGGADLGIENLQTLCHPCHKVKTKLLNQKRFSKKKVNLEE